MKMKMRVYALACSVVLAVSGCLQLKVLAADQLDYATTTFYGDVNCDGSISIVDATALNLFLSGKKELQNYNNADTNANCVIDTIDADILMRFIVGSIKSLPYMG